MPIGLEPLQEEAKVTILKGPPQGEQVGVLLYADGASPVSAELLFQGELIENGSMSELLETNVPLIPSVPEAGDVVVTRTQLSIGPGRLTYYKHEHGRTVGYHPRGFQVPETCPSGGFRFGMTVKLADGTVIPAAYTIPCPASHHRHPRVGR